MAGVTTLSSLSTTVASTPSNRNTGSPPASELRTLDTATDLDSEGVISMDDLVKRGAVVLVQQDPPCFEIPGELISAGRSSITIGAALGGDKRRFNLKWLYDYQWLCFDMVLNSMFCTLCKRGKRANQFAKRGSRNFKTSALVDHSSSNDHQRSVEQFDNIDNGNDLALMQQNSVWITVPKPLGVGSEAAQEEQSSAAQTLPHQLMELGESGSYTGPPAFQSTQSAADEGLPGEDLDAPRTTAIASLSTADTLTTVASQSTSVDDQEDESPCSPQPLDPKHQEQRPELHELSPVRPRTAGLSAGIQPTILSQATTTSSLDRRSTNTQPDEKYVREFGHAVQALLQAMNLNLPISAVADLYRLKIDPMPLASIGSVGYVDSIRSAAAAADHGNSSRSATDLRLAGATANSTEAARILQHVVSSEILSLVKDEVSQSPAFSVIIDEAPLREHNSLVAHALLYFRYMRRDPQSDTGELQVITRFWRCVHLYHESKGRLARRDPTGLVLALLERARIDSSRLVCISCERPATHEDEGIERQRHPHVIHWRGIFTYPNSLSPQVYEEIINQSEDFVGFAMTLMDLCLFMYSHPSSFAFLGVDFQETLYKTLYEIFLGECSLSTRLPISLTPAIAIAITRNMSQVMATVLALSKVSAHSDYSTVVPKGNTSGAHIPGTGDVSALSSSPRSPRSSLQIPLPVVDILVSTLGGVGSRKSVGRCPPAEVLLERLRDYNFLGCLHFMADILSQVKPIIDTCGRNDMPVRAFGELVEPADHSLDQRLRAYIGTIRDAIESVTLMYGDEHEDRSSHDHSFALNESDEEEYAGFHLNEFMHLTDNDAAECWFRTFRVANYVREESQARLVELIHAVSSAILHDLNQRFNAVDIASIQELADMWDPTQFPQDPAAIDAFGSRQASSAAWRLSQIRAAATGLNLFNVDTDSNSRRANVDIERSPSNSPLVDPKLTVCEWSAFKNVVHQSLEKKPGPQSGANPKCLPALSYYPPGKVQLAYRDILFPQSRLAPSRRRLRSMKQGNQLRTAENEPTGDGNDTFQSSSSESDKFSNLKTLATAWNVLPLALSTDLQLFRRLYERQLSRICREQAENKLQSISFDMGDTFSELLNRLSQQNTKGKKVAVYDLLQNSKFEIENEIGSFERPVEIELSGVTIEYFLRSIDAVTMALDHRLRLLSIGYTETPLAVASSPGECPKWMQNAMRGYWKLACRPPRSSAMGKSVLSAPSYYGPHHRLNPANVGVPTLAGNTPPTPNCSAPNTAAVYKHSHLSDASSGPASATVRSNTGAQPPRSSRKIEPLRIHPLSSVAHEIPASSQPSLFLSPSLQTQAAFGDDNIGTLPLLEALLSTTTAMPFDSAPASLPAFVSTSGSVEKQHAATVNVSSVDGPATTGVGKRLHDGKMANGGANVQPSQGGRGVDSLSPGMPMPKRMRHVDRSVASCNASRGEQGSGFRYGYPEAAYSLSQQRLQRAQLAPGQLPNTGQSSFPLGHDIARLASDMGLDSINAQALAANMSNQSVQMLPAASIGSNNPGVSLPVDAAEMQRQIQQQQQQQQRLYQHNASIAGGFVLPNSANPQMFATAVPTSNPQQQQYAAGLAFASQMGGQFGMPSLPAVPSLSASHMGPGQPLDQMVVEMQRPPHPTSVAASAADVGSVIHTNEFEYRIHGFVPDGTK
ncbi:hypothetical protein H4R24_005456 [Coemansia sp. RSA 988]|nr:hypothetical protein H4R24_005456 [Coemansia sp. RSA 988]